MADETFRKLRFDEAAPNVLTFGLPLELRDLSTVEAVKGSMSNLSQLAAFMGASVDMAPTLTSANPEPVSIATIMH